MAYLAAVERARSAIDEVKRWEARKKVELGFIIKELRAQGVPRKGIKKHPEIRRWMKKHPRPKTADDILEEVAQGDQVLWTRLANMVTAKPEDSTDEEEEYFT